MRHIAKVITEGSRARVFLENGEELGGLCYVAIKNESRDSVEVEVRAHIPDIIASNGVQIETALVEIEK